MQADLLVLHPPLTRPAAALPPSARTGRLRSRSRTTGTGALATSLAHRAERCVEKVKQQPPRRRLTSPSDQGSNGGGGGGGNKRANARAGSNKDGVQDRTLLPPGEAGAEIVRSANPWTRSGPSDDNERLLRNVKRCGPTQSPGGRHADLPPAPAAC